MAHPASIPDQIRSAQAMAQHVADGIDRMESQLQRLAELSSAANAARVQYSRKWHKQGQPALADGTCDLRFTARQGISRDIKRLALTGTVTTTCDLYLDSIDPVNLVQTIALGATGRYTDAFLNLIYVPAGSSLIVHFAGQTPGLTCTAHFLTDEYEQ